MQSGSILHLLQHEFQAACCTLIAHDEEAALARARLLHIIRHVSIVAGQLSHNSVLQWPASLPWLSNPARHCMRILAWPSFCTAEPHL